MWQVWVRIIGLCGSESISVKLLKSDVHFFIETKEMSGVHMGLCVSQTLVLGINLNRVDWGCFSSTLWETIPCFLIQNLGASGSYILKEPQMTFRVQSFWQQFQALLGRRGSINWHQAEGNLSERFQAPQLQFSLGEERCGCQGPIQGWLRLEVFRLSTAFYLAWSCQ